jgi:DNA-directed RNA polymerase specialized sigma24 family protein
LEHLVRQYLRPSYVIALATLGSPDAAEIVAQDTLRETLRGMESYGDASWFSCQLFTKVRERAKACLRGRPIGLGNCLPRIRDDSRPSQGLCERDRLLAALCTLETTQREVVLLHDLAAWSHRKIATALGIREEESCRLLSQARMVLRKVTGDLSDKAQ